MLKHPLCWNLKWLGQDILLDWIMSHLRKKTIKDILIYIKSMAKQYKGDHWSDIFFCFELEFEWRHSQTSLTNGNFDQRRILDYKTFGMRTNYKQLVLWIQAHTLFPVWQPRLSNWSALLSRLCLKYFSEDYVPLLFFIAFLPWLNSSYLQDTPRNYSHFNRP